MVFAVTGMANLVTAFAINSMTLALPGLEREFGVSQAAVSWLAIVYPLIPCCTLLIFGRTAELFGYKRQFGAGFLFFGAVCLAAPLLSRNIGGLIFFRCLQGLGYSVMISITQAIVSRAFPESERGRALGVNSVFVSVGLAAGPTVGGFLLTYFSWRALFYFNVPFCLFGFWAVSRFLPEDVRGDSGNKKARRMDVIGALLFSVSVGVIVLALNFGDSWGFLSVSFIGCAAGGVLGLAAFVRYETAAKSPMMNLRLFRDKTFSLANAVCLISYTAQQLFTYLMPFYLINMLSLGSSPAGLIMLANPIMMMVFSPLGGGIADKKGTRLPVGAGLGLFCAACLVMGFFGGACLFAVAIVTLVLVGAGNGLSVPAINTAILGAAPPEHVGVASGMLATMRNLGQTLGSTCGVVMLTLRQPAYGVFPPREAYLFAQRDAFFFGLFALLAALALLALLPAKPALKA